MWGRTLAIASSLVLLPAMLHAAEPTLKASLRDPEANAQKRGAVVEVQVSGLELVDPGPVKAGQGHLHYRVDKGPVIATVVTKLGFHELTPGRHRVEIRLVGNDHQPLGPMQVLSVEVPGSTAPASRSPEGSAPPAAPAPRS